MYPVIELGPFLISSYKLMLVLSLLMGYYLFRKEIIKNNVLWGDEILILTFYLALFLVGLITSKIPYFINGGKSLDLLSNGSWYYGVLGSFIVFLVLAKIFSLSILEILDLLSPIVVLCYGIAKIGCFLAGDFCYGRPTTLPWGVILNNEYNLLKSNLPLHPVPVYETILSLIIYFVLKKLRNIKIKTGLIFVSFLILFGLEKYLMEELRINVFIFLDLTETQIISLSLIIIGVILMFILLLRNNAIDMVKIFRV